MTQSLIGRDDHVGGDEEGPVLGGRHHVVRLIPDSLVQNLQLRGHGLGHVGIQTGDGVAFHLAMFYVMGAINERLRRTIFNSTFVVVLDSTLLNS